jgi:hypothetical protein
LVAPRTEFSEALKRKEAGYTGIYLLIGEKEGQPLAYVGQADKVGERIRNHEINKDWWTSAILITADNKLNTAHVRYLESRLISLARAINRINLDNGTTPALPALTEPEKAYMEEFLDNILMVLPVLRIDSFVNDARPETAPHRETTERGKRRDRETVSGSPLFETQANKAGVLATARQLDGKFAVEKGSAAALEWHQKGSYPSYGHLFHELVQMEVLQKDGHHRVFSKHYAFASASAAASVVKGRPTSGPNAWKIQEQQKTLKDWEKELATDGS